MKKMYITIFIHVLFTKILLAYTPINIQTTDGTKTYSISISKEPHRVFTTSQFMTELLISLGKKDSIVGMCWPDDSPLPKLEKEYNEIPLISDRYPSKEVVYSLSPDFISGWYSSLNPKMMIGIPELISNNITPYTLSSLKASAQVENLYYDFDILGQIFNATEKADSLKLELERSINKSKVYYENKNKKRVFAYDSGTATATVVGGGSFIDDLISKAGGENIFKDIEGSFVSVSWEDVIIENPEYIILIASHQGSFQDKIYFFKKNKFTKHLDAVKKDNFILINLADLSPGVRTAETINNLSDSFFEVD